MKEKYENKCNNKKSKKNAKIDHKQNINSYSLDEAPDFYASTVIFMFIMLRLLCCSQS